MVARSRLTRSLNTPAHENRSFSDAYSKIRARFNDWGEDFPAFVRAHRGERGREHGWLASAVPEVASASFEFRVNVPEKKKEGRACIAYYY